MPERYMKRALELAALGTGYASPNPLVGAVIVKDGVVIGEGYHQKYGMAHAEINAFHDADSCGNDTAEADLYVTLEPCSHYGKTPPCAEEVISRKIKRVFIGMKDPNPLVAGRGILMLQKAGIEVSCGILESECRRINEPFIKFITTKLPFVFMKSAMTLDGKIASYTGDSRWVSCPASRELTHHYRNKYMAIMVGCSTVVIDNPELTCRLPGGRNPLRIIVDSKAVCPEDSKVFQTVEDKKTLLAVTKAAAPDKIMRLRNAGVEVIVLPEDENGRVNLCELMKKLGEMKIDSVLLEGGGTLNFSALKSGIVDRAAFFIAPKIIGGKDAKTPVEGDGMRLMSEAINLEQTETTFVGNDLLITGLVSNRKEAQCLPE